VTTWDEARTILEPIAEEIHLGNTINQYSYYSVYILPSDTNETFGTEFTVSVNDNIVESINFWLTTPISDILRRFGTPDQIYYFGTALSDTPRPIFGLFLAYPSRGILIEIIDIRHSQDILLDDGTHLRLCTPDIGLDGSEVILFSAEDNQFADSILDDWRTEATDLHDINSSFGIGVGEFFQTFSDPFAQACLTDLEPFPPEWVGQ
jgi:hypothetical protein